MGQPLAAPICQVSKVKTQPGHSRFETAKISAVFLASLRSMFCGRNGLLLGTILSCVAAGGSDLRATNKRASSKEPVEVWLVEGSWQPDSVTSIAQFSYSYQLLLALCCGFAYPSRFPFFRAFCARLW